LGIGISAPSLTGVFPVAPTIFSESGELDIEGQKRVLDCMIDQGADGICILANYSEQFVLSDGERTRLVDLCLDHVAGRVPVIVTCSHYCTAIAAERAGMAAAGGAAMVMLMPPYHGTGLKVASSEIVEHFAAVAKAAQIPLMIQDAPLSGVELDVSLLVRLASEIPQVRYFKIEVPFAAAKLRSLIAQGGDIIGGPFDGEESITLMADLDAGATGTMCSALLPDLIRPVVIAHREGRRSEAAALYARILPLINYENRQCGLRAAKAVLKEGGVIRTDKVRHPQVPLHPGTRGGLLELAREADVLALRWAN